METGWISKAERMPGPADADLQQCVVVWHELNGAMITGWHQLEENRFMTHWMPCPPAPTDYPQSYQDTWNNTRGSDRRRTSRRSTGSTESG